jgi:hypothetical protein
MPSAVATLEQINAFLPENKLQVANLNSVSDLHQHAINVVFGKLRTAFDTTTWQDSSSTPKLVQTAVAMLVAGNVYLRQLSEESTDGNNYGQWRINEAYALLQGILEGVILLEDDKFPNYRYDPLLGASYFPTEPVIEMGMQF